MREFVLNRRCAGLSSFMARLVSLDGAYHCFAGKVATDKV